jgi:Flp pilus assembly protein TadD
MYELTARKIGRAALIAGALTLVTACNTTPSKQTAATPARIEVTEAIGFTITEEARISGDIRSDYDRALDLLGSGQVEEGMKLLETVVESSPQLSAPRIDLAIAYHNQGDLETAEQHLANALEVNPNHPIAHNELGIIYRKTARFSEARRSYEAALAVYPGYHYARRNLAVLCDLFLDDLGCARENYEAYMATVHSDEEASLWLRNVRFRMGDTEN